MKKKLNIAGLKITSFVTDLSSDIANTVKGGRNTHDYNCASAGCNGGGSNTCGNDCGGSGNPC